MPLGALMGAGEPLASWGPLMLGGGLVAVFACSRILATILPRRPIAPGARALGFFIPIAAVAIVATLMGHPEIGLGVVFGTSVGAMTTVVGFLAIAEPVGVAPPRWRRLWPFPLAAALIVFVAGFKGLFHWRDAIALMVEGLVVAAMWFDRTGADAPPATPTGPAPATLDFSVLDYATPTTSATPRFPWIILIELALVAAVLGFGGWAVTRGADKVDQTLERFSTAGLAASVVSLALVLPMTYGVWRRGANNQAWEPMTTQVGIVLLNLCALLPVLILLPYLAALFPSISQWAGDGLIYSEGSPKPLLFNVAFWRIDNVILIVVGVLLLPVAVGKWSLGREEGMTLIAAYFFYLTAILWTADKG